MCGRLLGTNCWKPAVLAWNSKTSRSLGVNLTFGIAGQKIASCLLGKTYRGIGSRKDVPSRTQNKCNLVITHDAGALIYSAQTLHWDKGTETGVVRAELN
jgi:hypothetical protein